MSGDPGQGITRGRSASPVPGVRVACLSFVLMMLGLLGPSLASAASWETVKTFAPLVPTSPNPPSWPEDVQLGGISGMAVNVTGAGGVTPGTIYTIGFSKGEWHAARYSPEGEFELAWTKVKRCGPKATPVTTCPTYPTGASGGVDIAVDQATGNVYVFYVNETPKAVRIYKPDGTGPIGEFGELDATGTATSSPGKLHGSPLNENIAVDESGTVYILDEDTLTDFYHRVMVFHPESPGDLEHYVYAGKTSDIAGGFLPANPPFRPLVDNAGDVYVSGETYIEKYDPAVPGTPLCTFNLPTGGITSVTINPATGAPFYYSFKDRKVHQLSPCNGEGKFVEKDSEGNFTAGPPFSAVPQRGFLEAMAFNPVRQFSVDRAPGVLYAGTPEPCPPVGSCPPAAEGQSSLGYMFATPVSLKPAIVSESVTNVGVTSATLNAQVNPKGSQTKFAFQYLTEAAYQANPPSERFAGATEVPLKGAVLGSGQQPLLAAVTISGLGVSTQYRYRVLATNQEGTAEGVAEAFRTFSFEVEGLPDSRGFELVSPAQKNGGEVLPGAPNTASCGNECKPGLAAKRYPVQVSPDGESIVYQGSPFLLNEGSSEFDEYLSTRTGSGWQTTSMSPPLVGNAGGVVFEAFGFDTALQRGIVYATNAALTPEAPPGYRNLFSEPTSNRFDLTPLLKATPHRLPSGAEAFKMTYAGASTDLSRVFFEANDALPTAEEPQPEEGGASKINLYEWSGGQLHLVNVLPGGTTTAGASIGSGLLLSTGQPPATDFSHAISADGSRVFWTSESGAEAGQLFVRVNGKKTVKIPGPGNCKASVPQAERSCFLTASVDGSEVLLSNGQIYILNKETGAYQSGPNLTPGTGGFQGLAGQSDDLSHLYFVTGPSQGTGDLTSGSSTITDVHTTAGTFAVGQAIEGNGIPAGTTITGLGAGTLELSAAATASGGDVPLTAQGLPTGSEENSQDAKAQVGGFNLYSWDEGDLTFVGTLLASDNGELLGAWKASPVRRGAEASPDGRWLAFNSKAVLSGASSIGACEFDPSVGKYVGSVPCEEVFLYDSQTGALSCPSCNPTGESPLGGSFLRRMMNATGSQAQPRYLTDSGRLYFDSRDALSSLDSNNGVEDVYQYEPAGVGSCGTSGGCVSLVSSGRGSYDSNFLATDSNGANVFFTTRQRLVPRDEDALIDLYDARVGGGIASESAGSPPECVGEGCQPLPPVQSEPSPTSQSFQSSGNAKPKKPPKKHHKKKSKGKQKNRSGKHRPGGSK